MAKTYTWDSTFEATPPSSESVGQGDDRIRDLKVAIRERLETDHYFGQGNDDDEGKHYGVRLKERTTAPSTDADDLALYVKDVSGTPEAFLRRESDGTEYQITGSGSLNPSELLTQLKKVDGTGSGLDADLLDGKQGSGYQSALGYTPVNKAGDTMTGLLTLSGNPTAALNAATKQYVDGTMSLNTNGYAKLPGGLVIQWGKTPSIPYNTNLQITFPTAFPNACFSVVVTQNTLIDTDEVGSVDNVTTTTFTLRSNRTGDDAVSSPFFWIAIGH